MRDRTFDRWTPRLLQTQRKKNVGQHVAGFHVLTVSYEDHQTPAGTSHGSHRLCVDREGQLKLKGRD